MLDLSDTRVCPCFVAVADLDPFWSFSQSRFVSAEKLKSTKWQHIFPGDYTSVSPPHMIFNASC